MISNNRILVGASVYIAPRGKGNIYCAEFSFRGKHCRRSLKTRNVKVARQRALALERTLDGGTETLPTPKSKPIKFDAAIDAFLEHQRLAGCRRKTLTKYRGVLLQLQSHAQRQHVTEVGSVDLPLVDAYRTHRSNELSMRSMFNEAVILKTFLGWCADRGYTIVNPLGTQNYKRPKCEPRGGPDLDQINQILAHASPLRVPVFAMLAFTGMRAGECQHLRFEDVDFKGGWIHVVSREGAETKTGNSRKLPLHPRLRLILEGLPRTQRTWFFTALPSRRYPSGDHHLNMKHVNEDILKFYKKLGILAGKKSGGFTLHSLRSSFKTIVINAGVPREVVDHWQDHAGRRPTASDAYYKLSDTESQQFMQKVPFGTCGPAADAGQTTEG